MDDFLNESEISQVNSFCQNKVMMEAVKKVLLASVYSNGTLKPGEAAVPKKNFILAIANKPEMTNEAIGSEVRAAYWGVAVVEEAFTKLEKYKVEAEPTYKEINEAL